MFNEQQMRQAEDRIHRIPVPVEVFEIIPIEDVDEYIQRVRKDRATLDRILGETNETRPE